MSRKKLKTRWADQIDREHVLGEYPRPLLVRESYVNLNGYWDYAFTKKFKKPETYDGRILVRESGTEPLLRVMVEATTQELCEKYVNPV